MVVLGISHKTASISDLEDFQLNKDKLANSLHHLKSLNEIEGVVIISTCNRVEFYLSLNKNIDPFSLIADYFTNFQNINIASRRESFYNLSNGDVANHLFKVVSGLDSMVLGEYQIQGQIKDAYSIACSEKTADKILHKLFHAAFRVGKTIRSKTKIGSGKQSVSGLVFQILKEKLSKNDAIAIIGVNHNTRIIAEKLKSSGYSNLLFINRTLYKAEKLVNEYSGKAFGLDEIEDGVLGANCIFSCTGAPGYIITSEKLKRIITNSNELKLIFDIAVPRDIDISNVPEEVEVFDLEGLKAYLKNQAEEIALDLPVAEKIISSETNIFEAWSESQNDDTIAYYDEKFESMRLQFLNESKENLSEEEFKLFDKFSRSLMHRIKSTLHQAINTNNNQNKAS